MIVNDHTDKRKLRTKHIPERNCLCCHKGMKRIISGRNRQTPAQYKKRVYCSAECRKKHMSTIRTGNNNSNYKGGVSKCIDCNKNLSQRYKIDKRCKKCWYVYNSGSNSVNWRGGIKSFYELLRSSTKLIKWRNEVYKRDNYTCQNCGDNRGGNLNADHIKPFALILKENNITSKSAGLKCKELWDINNGRTLCVSCHKMTDTYGVGTIKIINNLLSHAN